MNANDPILRGFCERQFEAIRALAGQSDVIEVRPLGDAPAPVAYHISFYCKTLVFDGDEVREASRAEVGFFFSPDYMERVDPVRTVTVLHPFNLFHPNILGPLICIGRMRPGTELVDLVYQVFEILTFQKKTTHDALNKRAAQWCRNHQSRLPLERRSLKRRPVELAGEMDGTAGGAV